MSASVGEDISRADLQKAITGQGLIKGHIEQSDSQTMGQQEKLRKRNAQLLWSGEMIV